MSNKDFDIGPEGDVAGPQPKERKPLLKAEEGKGIGNLCDESVPEPTSKSITQTENENVNPTPDSPFEQDLATGEPRW